MDSDTLQSASDLSIPDSRPKRPFTVTVLILLVLCYSSLAWLGFFEALRHWEYLGELPLAIPLIYLALRGAFWGLVGLPLVWSLWVGRTWAWYAIQIAAALYATHYWLDRFFLADPAAISQRWPFAIGLSLFLLAYTFIILRLPKSRKFFHTMRETTE
jgi:hypothetical protein